jgi:hypothetical protein
MTATLVVKASPRRMATAPSFLILTGDPQEARSRKRRAPSVVCPSDEELAEYAKQVVDGLPSLTDEQRDLLALIFHSNRDRRPLAGRSE